MTDAAVSVRQAAREDIPRLAELLSELASIPLSLPDADNRFTLIANDPEQELLVACVEGRIVGLLAFRIRHNLESVSHYGEVASIVVDAAHRGLGIGKILVDAAERLAKDRRCIGLWLVSGFGREAEAHRFYERIGFARTGFRFVRMLRD